ncbi:acyltransferase domain-containing protein [Caldimonas tepidiphila]|uniref:acyltransferase domain-containing protein n=1 Tax=Caldimonas tepidiphila TaxID=2315841 RepID=UPI000E5B07A9|nr:acyltransferase domain-containing protein [Caldimonas tepidiphila]
MSYAVLFPGQGSQHAQMLPWLDAAPEAAPLLQAMAAQLGADWRTRLDDEAWRSRNEVAQPLVTGTSLAAWAALAPLLPQPPAIVAGYSVGELAAFACAGLIEPAQALELAGRRAALMDRAVEGLDTGLLSVAGPPGERLERIVAECGLECALRIAADHRIWAGTAAALDAAQARLAEAGFDCRRLPIRVASHSSWMRPAAQGLRELLAALPFARARCPVAVNAGGAGLRDASALKAALSTQIDHPVDWAGCMETVAQRRVRCVVEVGAGTALVRMWTRRHPEIPARSLEDFRGPEAFAEWVRRQAA